MALDLRPIVWQGTAIATAQSGAVTIGGFTLGHVYQVKAAAVDNTAASAGTASIYLLVVDDNLTLRAVGPLPETGAGPFTFQ
jgi:hypothetical protein